MSHGLQIPVNDRKYFASLPASVQCEIYEWFDIVRSIVKLKYKAREIRGQILRMKMNGRRGFSKSNIIRKYYLIRNGGAWRCLINHSKLGRNKETTENITQ